MILGEMCVESELVCQGGSMFGNAPLRGLPRVLRRAFSTPTCCRPLTPGSHPSRDCCGIYNWLPFAPELPMNTCIILSSIRLYPFIKRNGWRRTALPLLDPVSSYFSTFLLHSISFYSILENITHAHQFLERLVERQQKKKGYEIIHSYITCVARKR
jgi:hypothetical protein